MDARRAMDGWTAWGPTGVEAGIVKLFGGMDEDVSVTPGHKVETFASVGGKAVYYGGTLEPQMTVPFVPFDSAFLHCLAAGSYILRPRGAGAGYPRGQLTALDVKACDGAVTRWLKGAKVNALTIGCAGEGQPVRASADLWGISMSEADFATGSTDPWEATYPTFTPASWPEFWYWKDLVVSIAGGTYPVKAWQVTINNNLTREWDQNDATSGVQRCCRELVEGDEVIDVEATLGMPLAASVAGTLSDQITGGLAFSASGSNGAATLTVALTGAHRVDSGDNAVKGNSGHNAWQVNLRAVNPAAASGAVTLTVA